MRKLELILGLSAIFGIALKLFSISGGGIVTLLAFLFLSMFYYMFSFALFNGVDFKGIFKKQSYKDTNAKKIVLAIILGFGLSLIVLGGLFVFQLYSGAKEMLMLGLITLGIILIIAVISYFRNKAKYNIRLIKRIAIYGILGIVLYLLPKASLVGIYYNDYPEYAEKYIEVLDNPDDIVLQEELYVLKNEMYDEKMQGDLNDNE